ncbi:MAG: ABC transporter permease [Thermoanaerobaculia bacterium]
MNGLLQDLRYALRGFRKAPGFTAIAIATLALGIGANTAIFTVVDTVLLRPLSFPAPDRLVTLWDRDSEGKPDNVGWPTYVDWRRQTTSFTDIAVTSLWTPTLTGGTRAQPLEGVRVTDGFFRVLGVSPFLGRDFLPEEDRKDRNHVVVLGHDLWEQRFGGDRGLVGKTISLGGLPYTVVGVLPKAFDSVFSVERHESAQIWSPLGYDASLPYACRDCRHLRAIGRLKPGVSLSGANADLNRVEAGLARAYPKEYASPRTTVIPLVDQLFGKVRGSLLVMLGAVALVLLMACVNVASLLLARLGERRREIAVRFALGASRGRVARLLLAESLLLSLLGGAAGLILAGVASRAFADAAPLDLPRLASVAIDLRVLTACLLLSLATGAALALWPAFAMGRFDSAAALADASGGSAGRFRRRMLGGLVVADVALALMLLSGATLLARSLSNLFRVDPGFDPQHVVKFEAHLSGVRYRKDPAIFAFYRNALERVRALPGVEAAATTSLLPLGSNFDSYGVHSEDRPNPNPENDPSADRFSVSDDYLKTMRIPVLSGRGFASSESAPVVLINRTFAKGFFAGTDPLGKRVKVGGTDGPWRTIVGIVGDVRQRGLDVPQSYQVYLPQDQFMADNDLTIVIRAQGRAFDVGRTAADAVAALDRDQVIDRVATMENVMAASAGRRRFAATVLGAFASMSLLLAAIGIYGVVSRAVIARRREFGIRMALGAPRAAVMRLVAIGTLGWVGAGLAVGVAGALLSTRLLQADLFAVGPRDPATLSAVVLLMAAVGLAAGLLPARRASRLDPMATLRDE